MIAEQKEAGDLLLEQGKLTEQQLEQVRRRQRRLTARRLGDGVSSPFLGLTPAAVRE